MSVPYGMQTRTRAVCTPPRTLMSSMGEVTAAASPPDSEPLSTFISREGLPSPQMTLLMGVYRPRRAPAGTGGKAATGTW